MPSTGSRRGLGVHPRVGGEARAETPADATATGPSPRGRGSPRGPSWLDEARRGPSPRGRGSRRRGPVEGQGGGSIPAWAGKPSRPRPRWAARRVHPRVGGEAGHTTYEVRGDEGPSPRGRGSRTCGPVGCHARQGPSPRGRGSPGLQDGRLALPGSIPAWAGKPGARRAASGRTRVHPRVGGEARDLQHQADLEGGPSPRGRGSLLQRRRVDGGGGSIPAWAGKPSVAGSGPCARAVHPRVGGEARALGNAPGSVGGPSPRGAGKP